MTFPVEEIWDQIGTRLREAREKADMTVDDVVYRARIPRTVVDALEADDFSVFTSPTYAKSFLKQYSEFLKVDADPWLNALEPASYVSGESWQPMFAAGEVPPRPSRDPRRPEQEKSTQATGPGKWSALWLMFLTAALVLAVIGGYQKFEEKFGKEELPPISHAAPSVAPPEKKPPAIVQPPAASAEAESLSPSEVKKEEERVSPPRAIIVRD